MRGGLKHIFHVQLGSPVAPCLTFQTASDGSDFGPNKCRMRFVMHNGPGAALDTPADAAGLRPCWASLNTATGNQTPNRLAKCMLRIGSLGLFTGLCIAFVLPLSLVFCLYLLALAHPPCCLLAAG
ncbi:uncharacterized protein SPSK_08129 [Sporothrix schenckii 1099-18]|uniref:Uncharacterized protein n=1 Tax=Sporothrix schenckii 1099-18 TaxID=1397361 RepID=A0A0F2MGW2_SPOSC|nr:uncharacterized protein SPSK_08129 [Sporothrix schenckii 1099-18]KJR88309.1 hypothetical protein SPSK_08129 [Sporothrix schenckii 1099-18]